MIYKYTRHPSKLTTVQIVFDGGLKSEFDNKYPNGLAHFMEHLRFKGSNKYTSKELIKSMSRIGSMWNAYTSEDLVSYFITLPDENIDAGLELLSHIVLYPVFPENEINTERNVVKQEIRMYNDDISEVNYQDIMGKIFKNYLSVPVQGTEDSVDKITRQHILDFNSRIYTRDFSIYIVGQNNHNDLVEKHFGPNDGAFRLTPSEKVEYADSINSTIEREGFEQSSLIMAYGGLPVENVIKNEAATKVFDRIFGRGIDSRLSSSIRQDKGLVYGIWANSNQNREGSLFFISTLSQKENLDEIIETAQGEIDKIKAEMVSDDELIRAKNMIKSHIYKTMESSQDVSEKRVEQDIYGTSELNRLIKEMDSVSIEDVYEVANQIFSGKEYIQKAIGLK